ncbi:MAG: ATP-binding protein [Gammaproteobacteria bacterium]|nr:ATP-binding protein [Gammaproteobacteria bacterium]
MAITNHERVGKAMELLRTGLGAFVEREIRSAHPGPNPARETLRYLDNHKLAGRPIPEWDAHALLMLIWQSWNAVFRTTLGHAERNYVSELRDARNRWAHQRSFSTEDAQRILDSTHRLLSAISAPDEAAEADKMRNELLRLRFNEQARQERRRGAQTALKIGASSSLPAWREVVVPHQDVATGRYNQAEFAADLWQVYKGEGAAEYRDPEEFFRRTYLTESLRGMLAGAVRRVTSGTGDPVIQLQTNFGGGKTHSMLALYHLFSGMSPASLAGVDELMAEAEVEGLPQVRRVVLVGNKISPARPDRKPDGTVVRTLWGELAWQLGGRDAYARIEADDEKGTSPGDALRGLLNTFGPCVVLIDEWVAYARQLHDRSDLPAGSFETQFTFAQTLTESAKAASNCLLVISLPASDTAGSPHTRADDVEVGGVRGREALDRLGNVVGRLESAWHPATAEEGFAIVKRRLFAPMTGKAYKQRDVVARAFGDFYRRQHQEFPVECRDCEFVRSLKEAYPIHPEVFDRLYEDWSTLIRFQRTRGVLRLMAAVIHSLWEKGDKSPLIMPSLVPIDDPRVQSELTSYLPDRWVPIIESDVDGANSLPLRMDGQYSNLGKLNACRRVARTVYLGSAPLKEAARKGMDDRRVKLGCVLPGESPAIFGDALRRLSGAATYLYQDGPRVWYDTQPTVTKLAMDRAAQLERDPDKVADEIKRRVQADAAKRADFHGVHCFPREAADVPDDPSVRLAILGTDAFYIKGGKSPAEAAARHLLDSRGTAPRLCRNAVVFLAPDKTRLQDLESAVRLYLAWKSIVREKEVLNLDPFQSNQAENRLKAEDGRVKGQLPEVFLWLLAPVQDKPADEVSWEALRLTGTGELAVRASARLRREELLVTSYGGTRLRMDLDRIPLWQNHVEIRQLADHYSRYPYLQRVEDPSVIAEAVREGVNLITWETETFAYAEGYDEDQGRYLGLRAGQALSPLPADGPGLIVRPEIARKQMDAERPTQPTQETATEDAGDGTDTREGPGKETGSETRTRPIRFHGSVGIDPIRAGKVVGQVAEEVVSHLSGLVGSKVSLTLEIEAELPDGAPDHVVRTVTENARTLRFETQGFEDG